MTIERAIEILDPEHREHYESIEPVNEACRMGIEALEKQKESEIIYKRYKQAIQGFFHLLCIDKDLAKSFNKATLGSKLQMFNKEIELVFKDYIYDDGCKYFV